MSAKSKTETLRERAREFPTGPGVYLMKDASGSVIYVGKAANLRSRVSSYFGAAFDNRLQTDALVRRVATLDYIVTDSEKEAFLLENALIKQHRPRYNVQFRDDKTYLSLRIDPREDWPRLQMVRKRRADGALYFGPYTSSHAMRETLRTILSIFPLRSCSDRCFFNRTRPCMLSEIGKCCGPCKLGVDKEWYDRMVQDVILFLRGRKGELIDRLKEQMEEKATKLDYEDAARLRDRVAAIQHTIERQRIAYAPAVNRDVIATVGEGGRFLVTVFLYRNGVLSDRREIEVDDVGQTEGDLLRETISQLYSGEGDVPDAVFVSSEPADRAILEPWLAERRGKAVELRVPQRGEGRRLMDLAIENARSRLHDRIEATADSEKTLEEIQSKLHLPDRPETIECFDISNIQGSLAVGSMVQFLNGEPNKTAYRMYKIRTVEGANDFAMMHEVLSRRYKRQIDEGRPLPDLVLIDGGKGQLNVAVEVMKELGAPDVPLRSIAKSRVVGETESRHRSDERLFIPGRKNPVIFQRNSRALAVLQHARDEAHRFAVTYHKKLRRQRTLRSLLEELPGIGTARKRALLRQFGSLARIREASVDELAEVPGMTRPLAEDLHRFLAEASAEKTLEQAPSPDQYPPVSQPAH
jgi:excinuclease ABC subunit C